MGPVGDFLDLIVLSFYPQKLLQEKGWGKGWEDDGLTLKGRAKPP